MDVVAQALAVTRAMANYRARWTWHARYPFLRASPLFTGATLDPQRRIVCERQFVDTLVRERGFSRVLVEAVMDERPWEGDEPVNP